MENPKTIIIGIDPGLTGAVAVTNSVGSGDDRVEIFDTPICILKKNKREYMPELMASLLQTCKDKILKRLQTDSGHVFIEKVHSMPKQGVASTFTFGKGYGIWLGILAALKLPHTLITPQAWKKELMQGMGDKDAARIRASELFPTYAHLFSRKKDIGRADSLLIAEYGRRTLK